MSKYDADQIEKETEAAKVRLTGMTMAMMVEGLSVQTIVLALLKAAASLAKYTGCSKEDFIKLTQISFDGPALLPPENPTEPNKSN